MIAAMAELGIDITAVACHQDSGHGALISIRPADADDQDSRHGVCVRSVVL
jgi:hypothetical protein